MSHLPYPTSQNRGIEPMSSLPNLFWDILIDHNKRMMERSRPSNNKPSLDSFWISIRPDLSIGLLGDGKSNMWVCQYVNMPICQYVNMRTCQYVSMYRTISMLDIEIFILLGLLFRSGLSHATVHITFITKSSFSCHFQVPFEDWVQSTWVSLSRQTRTSHLRNLSLIAVLYFVAYVLMLLLPAKLGATMYESSTCPLT